MYVLGAVVGDNSWYGDCTRGGEARMPECLDLFQSPRRKSDLTSGETGFRLGCDLTGTSPAPRSDGMYPTHHLLHCRL